MKSYILIIAFIGAGFVGGVAGKMLSSDDDALVESGQGDTAALEAKVDDLQAEVARLRTEFRTSRDASRISTPELSSIVPDASAEIAEASTAGGPGDAVSFVDVPADEVIEEKVRKVIEERTRAAQAAKAKRDEQNQRKKEAEWIAKLQKEHGLTDFQAQELTRMLIVRRQEMARFNERQSVAQSDAEKTAIQGEMRAYGEDLKVELRALLSPEQYEAIMNPKKPVRKDGGR